MLKFWVVVVCSYSIDFEIVGNCIRWDYII